MTSPGVVDDKKKCGVGLSQAKGLALMAILIFSTQARRAD